MKGGAFFNYKIQSKRRIYSRASRCFLISPLSHLKVGCRFILSHLSIFRYKNSIPNLSHTLSISYISHKLFAFFFFRIGTTPKELVSIVGKGKPEKVAGAGNLFNRDDENILADVFISLVSKTPPG